MRRILVTGGEGLIGGAITALLRRGGDEVRGLDLRAAEHAARGDITDAEAVARRVDGCDGIIHLAAVSRVVAGEQNPELCWATNGDGTRKVLKAALDAPKRPWVVVASSREVYGEPARLPVSETCPLAPVNIYGRSKARAEALTREAHAAGLRTAIVRFANVYGRTSDHADRVVPAFARAASRGGVLRVDGRDLLFDFTHIDDVADGLARVVDLLAGGERALPAVHFVSGQGTTLGELAALAHAAGGGRATIVDAPPRAYDVFHFQGDPTRARALLGWIHRTALADGVARLVRAFDEEAGASSRPDGDRAMLYNAAALPPALASDFHPLSKSSG